MRISVHSVLLGFCVFLGVCHAALLGIDYGQQYTKACVLAPGVPFEIVLTADSKRKDLSGLTFKDAPGTGGLERYYGNSAANLMTRFPSQSPFFFKPLLGSPLNLKSSTVKHYQNQLPGVKLIPSSNNWSTIAFSILDDVYPLEEILGMNVIDIKNRAKDMLGSSENSRLKGVVMTVPSFFDVYQRQAMEDAIDLSGLPLVSLIDSGSAVAVNFASTRQFSDKPAYFLVYDMGAGSTTATLVSIREKNQSVLIDVEGFSFDKELGGQYYTEVIKEKLLESLVQQNPVIKRNLLLQDPRAMSKLWKEAERVKGILSANTEVACRIESVYEDIDFRGHLTRADFESSLKSDVPRITSPVLEALKRDLIGQKSLDWKDLEGIIFMGGSTRVPFVQKTIRDTFPDKVMKYVNTDEAAVLGATLRGVGISKMFKSKNITVTDRAIWDYTSDFNLPSAKQLTLFKRGTPLNSITSVSFNVKELKDFDLTLSENGQEFAKYEVSHLSKTIQDLKLENFQNGYSLSINATFQLTNSRLVKLLNIWTEVHPVNTEDNEASSVTDSTQSVTESAKIDSPVLKKALSSKIKHLGSRPMGAASKEFSKSRINELERIDRDRKTKESIRNELEATLYRIKEIANSDPQDDAVVDEDGENKLLDTVNEYLDWLDFEGFQASTKELKQKLSEAKKLLNEHSPKPKTTFTEEHGNSLRNFTERLSTLQERVLKHREEDSQHFEQVIEDASSKKMDVEPIKKEMFKLLENDISEKKELENLLQKSVQLSMSILNALSGDTENIDKSLASLEKLVLQNEKLESDLNKKRKERLEKFKASVLDVKAEPKEHINEPVKDEL